MRGEVTWRKEKWTKMGEIVFGRKAQGAHLLDEQVMWTPMWTPQIRDNDLIFRNGGSSKFLVFNLSFLTK